MIRILAFLLVFSAMKGIAQGPLPTQKEFNQRASDAFLKSVDDTLLEPLNHREICVLKEIVANELNILNASRSTLFGENLVAKKYFSAYLEMSFVFIYNAKTKKFFFLGMFDLYKMLYDVTINYEHVRGNYRLKIPRSPIKLNTVLLNEFLSTLVDRSAPEAQEIAQQLIADLLPYASPRSIDFKRFNDELASEVRLGRLSDSSLEEIKAVTESQNGKSKPNLHILKLENFGYVITKFYVAPATGKPAMDLYFIPDFEGHNLSYAQPRSSRYENCQL
jgi:hypothetical protein